MVFLLCLLLVLGILNTPTMRTRGDDLLVQIPVIEGFDLLVDGSITPQVFTPNETFLYLMRVIWVLYFEDNDVNWDGWGTGAALTNGTAVLYDSVSLIPDNITHIHEFSHVAYDLTWYVDSKNPIDNHFASRFTFSNFVPDGLFMPGHSFQVVVQDNQTAAVYAIDYFQLFLEGYVMDQDVPPEDRANDAFRQAFGEKALVFPSPLYALGLFLLFFAASYAFYRKFIRG